MTSWLGINGAVLAFFGIGFLTTLMLFLKKNREFRAFDNNSELYLEELYQAFGKLNLKEINTLCEKEASPLAHLTQELIFLKDQYSQINTLEKYLQKEKDHLELGLEWLTIMAWLCPTFGTIAGLWEMSMLFTKTEFILSRAELGPIAIAIHFLICLSFILLGLIFCVALNILKVFLKTRTRRLLEELELSGQEIINLLKEVKRRP